jgi:hypothetical protein
MNGLGNWNADLNKDGRVSRTELLQFVRNDSRNFCRKIEQCQAGLTPTLEIRKDLLLASVGIDSVLSPSESSSSSPADKIGEIASLAPNKETTRLEILPGPKLKIGDPININLTSSRAGTAVLLDYDANGDLRQIFPNYYSGCISGSVQAHVPLTLPGPGTLDFRLTASPPTGKGVLAAIVVHDNADLSSITCKHHNMAPIAGNRLYVDDILSNLTKVWTGEKFDRALDWSGAFVEYEISN